jgi:hypothetical protein
MHMPELNKFYIDDYINNTELICSSKNAHSLYKK